MPIKRESIAEWKDITNKPSQFPPAPHAGEHASGGADAITPADIGAAAASYTHTPADIGAADAYHTHTPQEIGAFSTTPDWDSGWITVSGGNTYTFTHNLGTIPRVVIIWSRPSSDTSRWGIPHVFYTSVVYGTSIRSYNIGGTLHTNKGLTATTIDITIPYSASNLHDGTNAYPCDQIRVLMWK